MSKFFCITAVSDKIMNLSSNCSSRPPPNAHGITGTLRLHHHSPPHVVYPGGVIQHSDGATVTPRRLHRFQVMEEVSAESFSNIESSRQFYNQTETNTMERLNALRYIKQENQNDLASCPLEFRTHQRDCESVSIKNEFVRNYANVLNADSSNTTTFIRDPKVLIEADDKLGVPACQVILKNHNYDCHELVKIQNAPETIGQETAQVKIGKLSKGVHCSGNSNETLADGKPALSYIGLIAKAIIESPQGRLSLGSIYGWIENNYPYYKNRGQGWRNSVRHNLSLNDCFVKAGRCEDGKGNYWAIHPANLQDFLGGDFRQRRRSRRRGRKKEVDYNMYQMPPPPNQCSYMGINTAPVSSGIPFNPPLAINSLYSPYTEAERRAYRLDEALLRQGMNNPFVKWYNGLDNAYPPPIGQSGTLYPPSLHHWQGYADPSAMYHQLAGFTSPR